MRLLMIDNYDSFTYNLVQYLGELGAEVDVVRNDAEGVDALLARAGEGLVISPGPGTPDDAGVSMQAIERFAAAGVPVFGVSGDSLKSHGRFADKYELNFPLLSDPERSVADAYGALGEKSMYGRKVVGIIRSTFVIGPEGAVETVFSPVRVKGHVAAVAQALSAH